MTGGSHPNHPGVHRPENLTHLCKSESLKNEHVHVFQNQQDHTKRPLYHLPYGEWLMLIKLTPCCRAAFDAAVRLGLNFVRLCGEAQSISTNGVVHTWLGVKSKITPQIIVDHIANFPTPPTVVIVVGVVEHCAHFGVAESSFEVVHFLQATGALVAEAPWPFISLLECCAGLHVLGEVRELRDATTIVWNESALEEMDAKTACSVKAWQTSARHQVTRDMLQDPSVWLYYFVEKEANCHAITHLVEFPAMQDAATSEMVGNDSRSRLFATIMAGMLSVLAPQLVVCRQSLKRLAQMVTEVPGHWVHLQPSRHGM